MKLPLISVAADFSQHFKDKSWHDFASIVCQKYNVSFQNLQRAEHGENIVFLIDDRFVLKIFTPFKNGFQREKAALDFARNKSSLQVPEILFEGDLEGFDYLITTQFKGDLMTRETWLRLESKRQIRIISDLAVGLKELHSHDATMIDFEWQKFIRHQVETVLERQRTSGARDEWLARLPFYLEENLKLLPKDCNNVFQHGDVHFGNLRLRRQNGNWQIAGLFDFADSLKGFHEYEFVALGVLMIQGQGELQREFFRAYGYAENQLDETLRRRMMILTILYEHSSLQRYALRLKPEAVDFTLDELERAIWNFV